MNASQVLQLLVDKDRLEKTQVEEMLSQIQQTGKEIHEVLLNYEIFESAASFWEFLAEDLGAEYRDLALYDPPQELLATVPAGTARLYGALPLDAEASRLSLALVDPLNTQIIDDLRFALEKNIRVIVAPPARVQELVDQHYGSGTGELDDILGRVKGVDESGASIDLEALQAEANSAPIIRYVDLVIYQAIKERASDIHFEPFEDEIKIRYRVDGALYEMAPPPVHLTNSIISRVKVMSNLNIAERRLPQDGRIMKTIDGRRVDLRVSTLPTQYGESVVLRVLDRSTVNLDLESLGMPEWLYNYIIETIKKPNGIFICTGPTGAGKTTTLYAALQKVNTEDSKILTAEDPVEYDIEGIVQVPVNDAVGMTFSKVLRAFLRQDPDRIMVGEMRDVETARIAIQASLTGHLVFSTLHTNDAAGAITRLLDMGCEPFLVAATLETVLAQRLIRTICPACRTAYKPSEAVLAQMGLSSDTMGDKEFFTGKGCAECSQTGYKGRKGLYELMDISDPIRELIIEKAPTIMIEQKAVELGMVTLREDGLRNIYEGNTTIEEVLKYT